MVWFGWLILAITTSIKIQTIINSDSVPLTCALSYFFLVNSFLKLFTQNLHRSVYHFQILLYKNLQVQVESLSH